METGVLQKWVTAAGNANVSYVIQDEEEWQDMGGCSDATVWLDVRSADYSANNIYLVVETAPSKDGALFQQTTIDVPTYASQTAIAVQTLRGASILAPLARWARWKAFTQNPNSSWRVTFRMRVAKSRTALFTPMQLSGCQLWVRGDAGYGLSTLGPGATTASLNSSFSWTDISGSGNGPNIISGATMTYNLNPGSNPYIQNTTLVNSSYMRRALSGVGASHTLFVVANIPTPAAVGGMFAATFGTGAAGQNTAFSLWADTVGPAIVARTSTNPAGMNADIRMGSSAFGTTAIYMTDADSVHSTSHGYINGQIKGTAALGFAPGVPDHSAIFAQDGAGDNPILASLYEVILYNRILSTAERTLVHRYLGNRYAITVP